MNINYYKNELSFLDKWCSTEINEWLDRAILDVNISKDEIIELREIIAAIYEN